jgi:putative spermidine/putrescine transport system permease protein
MAAAVTIASVALGFPLAYYIARYTTGKRKAALVLAVLVPLWSSYLVRVYSWKLILSAEGIISWFFDLFGLGGVLDAILSTPVIGGPSLSTSSLGQFIVFVYIWLPYMVLPIQAAVERVPRSLLEASGDLGAHPSTTFRQVVWPLALPGVAAGSIFTFSLTLGDYIIPTVIGDSSPFIGLAIYSQQGVAGNLPLAAALSFVPVVVMALYLTGARKLGAFEAL